ncbi:MAG: hypothetical protein D8M58_04745 [Calditrichaeota bacterium]|nr:MAG: hypothetical protein DWQ03_02330 [Calditrichota bacterium]MBL1204680.1 hypothetical protein [Calditrichota bacterium]NOG44508.1 hypothetical protein [Calditrichota bacterium]
MYFSEVNNDNLVNIQSSIINEIEQIKVFENAAQKYMSILYENFSESIALCRLFATVPFKSLPASSKEFVSNLLKSRKLFSSLKNDTPILTLLGSRGIEEKWNDIRQSKGHIGIPLISSGFISEIPMVSRLLKELGLDLRWIDSRDTDIVIKTIGRSSGVFYVKDAAKDMDSEGRKIITSQDFVSQYNIKTVFGFGGGYLGSDMMFTVIAFCSEQVSPDNVRKFLVQANKFKTATLSIVDSEKIFI